MMTQGEDVPKTDEEFEDALESLGHSVEEIDDGWIVVCLERGGQTLLESDTYSGALFEAWRLVKD